MAQYCRYCNNLVVGDVPYCSVKAQVLRESTAKTTNHCKQFELNEIDAFGENLKGYRQRIKDSERLIDVKAQMRMF